jgi:hypothetical protein
MEQNASLIRVIHNIIELLPNHIITNNIDSEILDASFRNQEKNINPTDSKFIESLSITQIKEDSDECCCICMDSFKKGDYIITLPCKDAKHSFHVQNGSHSKKQNCSGILPWLSENNTCPICRTEFPKKEIIDVTNSSLTNSSLTNSSLTYMENHNENNSYEVRNIELPEVSFSGIFTSVIDSINNIQTNELNYTIYPDGENSSNTESTVQPYESNNNIYETIDDGNENNNGSHSQMINAMLELFQMTGPVLRVPNNTINRAFSIDEDGFSNDEINEAIRISLE